MELHPNHLFRLAWLRSEAIRYRKGAYDLPLANSCERLADMMEDGVKYEDALKMNRGFEG